MPNLRQVRTTRQAISPRLAMRILENINSFRQMAHRIDIVAVEVGDECAVVVGVIVGAQARRAVVAASRGKTGGVEGVHLGAAVGNEGDMGMRRNSASVAADPETGLTVASEAGRPSAFAGLL